MKKHLKRGFPPDASIDILAEFADLRAEIAALREWVVVVEWQVGALQAAREEDVARSRGPRSPRGTHQEGEYNYAANSS